MHCLVFEEQIKRVLGSRKHTTSFRVPKRAPLHPVFHLDHEAQVQACGGRSRLGGE